MTLIYTSFSKLYSSVADKYWNILAKFDTRAVQKPAQSPIQRLRSCLNVSPCRVSSEVSSPSVDPSSHECWSEDEESSTSTQEEMLSAPAFSTGREEQSRASCSSAYSSTRPAFVSQSSPRFNMLWMEKEVRLFAI